MSFPVVLISVRSILIHEFTQLLGGGNLTGDTEVNQTVQKEEKWLTQIKYLLSFLAEAHNPCINIFGQLKYFDTPPSAFLKCIHTLPNAKTLALCG